MTNILIMKTISFTTKDFKQTEKGFVFTSTCEDAENKKYAVEGLQPDGSYQEVQVVMTSKGDRIEITEEQPFNGRIIYEEANIKNK